MQFAYMGVAIGLGLIVIGASLGIGKLERPQLQSRRTHAARHTLRCTKSLKRTRIEEHQEERTVEQRKS